MERIVDMELGIKEIQEIIPHRFPFLMIDRVIDIQPNQKLTALKNVSVNEGFFVGHFPEEKVMPGVLIVEAMAQAGCIYFYYSKNLQGKNLIYYLAKTTVKFFAPVIPGDQLKIEVTTIKLLPKVGFLKTKAFVGEKLVAEAEIGFSVKEV
ncbi:MAG: 3-hydroxyacyl-ACP dehydratase FabZ [Candidatus Omnitrophica bacterium]|nr:3-hydroxyacyl-ACP dehydratase FabZ [Candidatus Omnitrophota bacterium]